MRRDAALFILGAWVMGTIFMALVATQNFYTIDRLLEGEGSVTFTAIAGEMEDPTARDFLRYLASELNRLFFVLWGGFQVVLAGILLILLWGRRGCWLALVAFALALVLAFGLTPPILSVGRSLDFVPREPPPPQLTTFGLLHAAYTILDLAKLLLALTIAWFVHRSGGPGAATRV